MFHIVYGYQAGVLHSVRLSRISEVVAPHLLWYELCFVHAQASEAGDKSMPRVGCCGCMGVLVVEHEHAHTHTHTRARANAHSYKATRRARKRARVRLSTHVKHNAGRKQWEYHEELVAMVSQTTFDDPLRASRCARPEPGSSCCHGA